MRTGHYSTEQIIAILERAERGDQTIESLCREQGIAEATFYRWR